MGNSASVSNQIQLPYSSPCFVEMNTSFNIQGQMPSTDYRLEINLFTTDDESGVALNITIKSDDKHRSITMNSKIDGHWGNEETVVWSPFKRGKKFILSVNTGVRYFVIRGNGRDLYLYNHRLPIKAIKRIGISANVPTLTVFSVSASDQILNDQRVELKSVMSDRFLEITKITITGKDSYVVDTKKEDDNATLIAKRVTSKHFRTVVTLRSDKFKTIYLNIKEDRVNAEKESEYSEFSVTRKDGIYFLFESVKLPGQRIGVEEDGVIANPSHVNTGPRSYFYWN